MKKYTLYVIFLPTQQRRALNSSQANAGDSRSVISVKGQVKSLSFDHTPPNESSSYFVLSFDFRVSDNNIIAAERARIVKAGYIVENDWVCTTDAKLSVSRALGDFGFKNEPSLIPEEQAVTADPDVTIHNITDEDEFLVLFCDGTYACLIYQISSPHTSCEGIWECLSSQAVVNFVRLKVSEGNELHEIGEMICNHCLAPDTVRPPPCNDITCNGCQSPFGVGHGCDNMTVLIVAILNGRTKEEWYTWITDRVQRHYGYWTPRSLPCLYEESRLADFNKREAQAKRDEWARCMSAEQDKSCNGLPGTGSAVGKSAQAGTGQVRE